MAIGPVQLLVLGFNHPNFHGEISRSWSGCATATPSG
jgi:hypothetical protein